MTAVNTMIGYTRDLRDAVTQRTHTVGANAFYQWHDYNARGLLWRSFASTSATKPGTADVTYTYRPSGQVQDRQFLGGPLVPVKYTIREQMERIGDPATTTYPFSARYAYHGNGTVSESEFYNAGSPATAKRYRYVFGTSSYDALNRLKSADFSHCSGGWVTTAAHDLANIGYDAAGNLTALQRYRETGTLIDNLTYTYPGSSNRLSSVTDAVSTTGETWDAESGSFTYDANGNMKTAPAPYSLSAITYDHQNLPTSLTRSGTTTTYRYDAGGMRISKQVGGGNTEVYLRDGSTSLGVFTVNGSGSLTSWHFNVLAGHRVIGRQPNTGNRRYHHTDLLGSTRVVVEGATIVESYDFEPWGLLMPGRTLGSGTKEGFTDKERDTETGLDYFGARYYMSSFARWTSLDPLGDKFPEWSGYNYVLNNPLLLKDPDGRCPIPPTNCADVAFFVYSAGQFIANPSWGTAAGAVVDGVGALPGVPSAGAIRRLGSKLLSIFRRGERTADAGRTARLGDEAIQGAGSARNAVGEGHGALQRLDEATFQAALRNGPEGVAGFQVLGSKGLVGDTFNRNIFYLESDGAQSIAQLFKAFESEALSAGATKLSIAGTAVINPKLVNPEMAARFGYTFEAFDDGTILLQKIVNPK